MRESIELRQALEEFYSALSGGDKTKLEGLVSASVGTLGIGTDAAEWWEGSEVLKAKIGKQMEEMGRFGIEAGGGKGWREGSVGWVADDAKLKMEDGTESLVRFSAVFHEEKGGWKIVQLHASAGVPNEYVVGKELTT